ncbi:MAG TPA: gamma-glutamyl-gamma-aminobutyrate hydrolase family protein [Bacteroidales bacterium]|nr:gamma-glutamyl-gamma-aminobutyrate hydrolase family protein [Bacteroidales bacterium]
MLVHPTEYNLELFTYLINQEIVKINDLNIVGIYHEKETYDYSRSVLFIEKNTGIPITFVEVHNDINPDNLYQENSFTDIYSEIFNRSDGILFMGGPDLPPAIYNQPMSLLTRMTDPYRHYFETSFLFHLIGGAQNPEFMPLLEKKPDYLIYGICLGMQTLNIAAGGTLIQDIASEVYNLHFIEDILFQENNCQHRNYYNHLLVDTTLFSGNFHQIKILDNIPLTGNYNENLDPFIYSNHHQAIDKLGQGLEFIATSTDGKIIEAIVHRKYPNVLGIQFHPEGTYLYEPDIKYRKNPEDKTKSGKQILEENDSYKFHVKFWETFSNKLK